MSKIDALTEKVKRLRVAKLFDDAQIACSAALDEIETGEKHNIHALRAYVFWERGWRDMAIKDVRTAIDMAPDHPGHRDQFMVWMMALKQYKNVIQTAKLICDGKVKFSERFSDSARFHMSYAYLQLRQWRKAATALDGVKSTKPIWVIDRLLSKQDLAHLIASKTTMPVGSG